MKKLLALITAAVLLLAAVPAFAFTGYDTAPDMPVSDRVDEPIFDFEIVRMENEPEINETPWGETYTTWVPMGSDPVAAVGETVTYAIEYELSDSIEGCTEEMLNQIWFIVGIIGITGVELVDATGLEPNITCDYELGYCYPLPGYGNAYMEGAGLIIEPKLDSSVQIILQGVAESEHPFATILQSVGQINIPTHFSVGKIENIDGGYYVYEKDFYAVQIRGMKFFTENDLYDHYYVCLNDIDYIRSVDTKGVSYTRVDDPSVVFTEGVKFQALERAYNDVMGFFGFTDDGVNDVMTDSVFLDGCESILYIGTAQLFTGEQEPEPTEPAPVDPTEPAPVDPTEPAPVDPTEPGEDPEPIAPPVTGAASIAVLGVLSVISGAGIVIFRRKND